MITREQISAASRVAEQCNEAVIEAHAKRAEEIASATQPLRDEITRVTEEITERYLDPLVRLHDARSYADRELQRLRAEFARQAPPPFMGATLYEWRSSTWAGKVSYIKLKRTATVEVWGPESIYPDNIANYSIPYPGDVVLRYINANGEPSKRFESRMSNPCGPHHFGSWYSRDSSYFLPEGVDPNKLGVDGLKAWLEGVSKQFKDWRNALHPPVEDED